MLPVDDGARTPTPRRPLPLPRPGARPRGGAGPADDLQASGAEAQLALCEPDHLRRLEQPLKYGFADRTSARKGLEVAAGVAIADRLGSIRQTAGPPIGRHGYMAIVWLGSRWLQLEQAGASAVPFTQYRLLHDFGWEESGKNARQALKRTLLNLQEARWEGEVNDSVTGRKTHEDHFGIIDRVLWPVVSDGRLERLGYIFLGSWFLEQLRHEAGVYIDWDVLRDLPPSPASCSGCWRTTASSPATTARSGRRTGSAPRSSPASAPPAPASATTSPPSCAPATPSPATPAPATASPRSGSPPTTAGASSCSCTAPPAPPGGAPRAPSPAPAPEPPGGTQAPGSARHLPRCMRACMHTGCGD